MKDNQQQSGNVLLYALLVISGLLVTTIVISNIVAMNLRESRFVSNAQAAFYGSESGSEKYLYAIRKLDLDLPAGLCEIGDFNCEWQIDNQGTTEIVVDLPENKSVQFDIFNIENPSFGGNVRAIELDWQSPDGAPRNTWLELSYIDWVPSVAVPWPQMQGNIQKNLYSPDGDGVGIAVNTSLDPTKNYRAKVKALYGSAENLIIRIYGDVDLSDIRAFPNFWAVKSIANIGQSNQAITTEFIRYPQALGLFDYVLFSEEPIVK